MTSTPFLTALGSGVFLFGVAKTIKDYFFNNSQDNKEEFEDLNTKDELLFDNKKPEGTQYSFVNQELLDRRNKASTETKPVAQIGCSTDGLTFDLKSIETKYSVVNQVFIDLRNKETPEEKLMDIVSSINEENEEERKLLYKAAYHENCNTKCIDFLVGTLDYYRDSKEAEIISYLVEKDVKLKKQAMKI